MGTDTLPCEQGIFRLGTGSFSREEKQAPLSKWEVSLQSSALLLQLCLGGGTLPVLAPPPQVWCKTHHSGLLLVQGLQEGRCLVQGALRVAGDVLLGLLPG